MGSRIEIILACTGIQGIAIMLGVAGAVPSTTRQKILSFLIVVPTIYILNIARNVAVIIAYTEQWFPYLPGIAGNGEYGYESFFWAHNVIAEGLALVLLIGIAYGLFGLIQALRNLHGTLSITTTGSPPSFRVFRSRNRQERILKNPVSGSIDTRLIIKEKI